MTPKSALMEAVDFVASIGIPVTKETGAKGFIAGIDIRGGGIVYDPQSCTGSNILHEAGHIACVPEQYRHMLNSNVEDCFEAIADDLKRTGVFYEPDHPLVRAFLQCSDPEATAWAWAAGHEAGIPPDMVILDHEYEGFGSEIRRQLMSSVKPGLDRVTGYLGIHGLAHAGFCALSKGRDLPMYPELKFWLQGTCLETNEIPEPSMSISYKP